jgi:hypothetical protein
MNNCEKAIFKLVKVWIIFVFIFENKGLSYQHD